MDKSGLILRKFVGYLVVFVVVGMLIRVVRGQDYLDLPWHIYGPGALLFTMFDVYIRPRFKGNKEE